jgi:pimeloyl-ACP methyl ester carboxylesterase
VLPEGFVRGSANVNGTQLSYVLGGQGAPVVFLHGWPQTSDEWRHVLAPLASHGYSVMALDLRGLGRSSHAADGYDKDNQAEDLRQLLRHVGLDEPAHVVGHDIGGMVAVAYARLHSAKVASLALIELAIPGYGLEEAMDVAHGGRWHFGLFMTPEVPELLFEGHERQFFEWWFPSLAADPSGYDPEALDAVTRSYEGREALRCGFAHYRTLLDDGRTNRAWGDAGGRFTMPVLAVGGEHAVAGRLADAARALAPKVQSAVIDGSGHFVAEERPAQLVAELVRFFQYT